jgi:hypothetical protein
VKEMEIKSMNRQKIEVRNGRRRCRNKQWRKWNKKEESITERKKKRKLEIKNKERRKVWRKTQRTNETGEKAKKRKWVNTQHTRP